MFVIKTFLHFYLSQNLLINRKLELEILSSTVFRQDLMRKYYHQRLLSKLYHKILMASAYFMVSALTHLRRTFTHSTYMKTNRKSYKIYKYINIQDCFRIINVPNYTKYL